MTISTLQPLLYRYFRGLEGTMSRVKLLSGKAIRCAIRRLALVTFAALTKIAKPERRHRAATKDRIIKSSPYSRQ